MNAHACDYPRCTGTVQPATAHRLSLPDAGAKDFCSLTCVWSWLQDEVHAQAKAAQAPTATAPVADPPRSGLDRPARTTHPKSPRRPAPPASVPVTRHETWSPPATGFPTGSFAWDLIPDEGGQQAIGAILDASIDGPYQFAWDARFPYVRIGPSTPQTPITVRAHARLHLMADQVLTLQGVQDTRDFGVYGFGSAVALREVASTPGVPHDAEWVFQSLESSRRKGRLRGS